MTLVSGLRMRSKPATTASSDIYAPLLPSGTSFRLLEGPLWGSGYWWYRVNQVSVVLAGHIREGWIASASRSGKAWIGPSPAACVDYQFTESAISVQSLAELRAGFVGTWAGCVNEPWIPFYWVTVTFRADGTYSATGLGTQSGIHEPAFYYGTDSDSPFKTYALNDFRADDNGVGQIDIVYDADSINRDELRNIMLMGDRLEFEFFHLGQYGPFTFRLYRIEQAP
jgi:hypothetical protein